MNVITHLIFPTHQFKAVAGAFMDPKIPKRPDYAKELSSIAYHNSVGWNAVYVHEIPDDKLADFTLISRNRFTFLSTRTENVNQSVHAGQGIVDSVRALVPLLP